MIIINVYRLILNKLDAASPNLGTNMFFLFSEPHYHTAPQPAAQPRTAA